MENNNKNNYDDFFKENQSNSSDQSTNQRMNESQSSSSADSYDQAQGGYQQTYDEQHGYTGYTSNQNERKQTPNVQDAQYTPISESNEQQSGTGSQDTMYYYSYGNDRQPESGQGNGWYGTQSSSVEHTPVPATGNSQSNSSGNTYRPFTTSQGGGNDPFGPKNENKKNNGFAKIFFSFMAGVIAVGLLMYTADAQNWFTKTSTNTQQSESTNKSSSSEQGSTASTSMSERPDNIAALFKSASPAVVKIETYTKGKSSGSSLLDDPFFRQFFGDSLPNSNNGSSSGELQQTGMGTGFFFDASGYILTNQHVIADADEIRVVVEGYDEPFVAKLLGNSYDLDLAVLKIEGDQDFPTLPLGSSDNIQIGDWVIAIGNPYGFDHTLTVGVLSAKERPIDITDTEGTRNYENLLQTDASINPGNSGGPLLNVNGEVIGINTAVSSTAQGIGFAIPTSTINEVLDSLKNNESLPEDQSPFIGAELQDLTEDIAKQVGLTSTEGTIVRSVYYNSPAYNGDLKQFDVITGVDDTKIKKTDELVSYIKSKEVGTTINLQVIRNGNKIELPITIGDKNEFGLQ